MNELQILPKGKKTITSLELAECINYFRSKENNRAELQHYDLLKIIKNEFDEEINAGKISAVEYKDKKGELRPMFSLTYAQAKQVLVRESKFVRKAVIKRLDELENRVQFNVPHSFSEALQLAADQAKQLELQAPKVLFADAVATSQKSCLIGELAKIIRQNGVEIGQNRLFSWMRQNGYLCQSGERYNQPTQKSMDLGLMEIKKNAISKPDGSVIVTITTKITVHGQIYFINKFLKKENEL